LHTGLKLLTYSETNLHINGSCSRGNTLRLRRFTGTR